MRKHVLMHKQIQKEKVNSSKQIYLAQFDRNEPPLAIRLNSQLHFSMLSDLKYCILLKRLLLFLSLT